ncbi:hypothetical protein [Treponema putidum]|uniref:hypothetical protein n=1 Tax=Treponema putidum TaxID=221027 RepID=UPI003D8E7C2D
MTNKQTCPILISEAVTVSSLINGKHKLIRFLISLWRKFNTNKKTTNEDVGFFSVENPSIIEPIASICSGRPNDALAPPHVDGGGSGGGGGGVDPFPSPVIEPSKPKNRR